MSGTTETELRTERITIVVTPSEHEFIRQQAFKGRKSLSTYCRDELMKHLGFAGDAETPPPSSFFNSNGRHLANVEQNETSTR